jgi:glycine dehydrogenase subunit 1
MRYLPLSDADRRDMLGVIGAPSVDALFRDVPESARAAARFDLPDHAGEIEVSRILGALAAKNRPAGAGPCFLGAGAYRHHVPAAVDHLIQRGEFLTSYTPYQPEISQGTLQAMFEFQTQVAMITGMDVANASMYDGATSTAEALSMAVRVTKRARVIVSGGLHPHYREAAATTFRFLDTEIVALPADVDGAEDPAGHIDADTACVVVQYPDVFGRIRDLAPLAEACHAAGALLVVAMNEVVALGMLRAPGEMGADIVAAEGRSLGNALNFGGPTVGLFASRDRYVRQMPGRLVGETTDIENRRGWVLTLATREQHIRREKATSNICTNSALCALAFTIHLALLGETGFRRLAEINHGAAVALADRLAGIEGIDVLNDAYFNEFTVRLTRPAAGVVDDLAERGILAGVPASRLWPGEAALENLLIVAATELTTEADGAALAAALEEVLK